MPLQASDAMALMPFIVSTGNEKPGPTVRRSIRSHVMKGKNRGKVRVNRHRSRASSRNEPSDSATPSGQSESSSDGLPSPTALLVPMLVPNMATLRLASFADPELIHGVLQFSSMARKVLFPLEASILFDKRDEAWLQPLAWDSAYLHAMVFTTQDYFGSLSPVASSQSKQQALSHCLTTLRLLRERMLNNPQMMLADSTVAAVLALAAHAHFVGDHQSARHHLDGLHRIVHLKGGPSAFKNNPKLLVEILRCDIGVALNINCPTLFFEQPDTLEAFMRCPQYQLPDSLAPLGATASAGERLDLDDLAGQMDDELGRLWSLMHEFCAMVNFATCSGYRISFDEFLSVMVSVSYRLLHMHFEDKRANEAIRLGLLAFSSGIFLQWRQLGLIYSSLSSSYRRCLLELKATDVSPEFALWLLMVGAVSVMDDTDIDWMRPLFVEKLEACHIRSWADMEAVMRSIMWVDSIHGRLGENVFKSLALADGT